jgi:hypothetical protein
MAGQDFESTSLTRLTRENPLPILLRAVSQWLGWTRASYTLMGAFVLTVGLIVYVWWPLAEEYLAQIDWDGPWWQSIDWLLIGIFLAMSLLIMAGADLRKDAIMILIGAGGGLVIESWGTQTSIWTYYTLERPPLWIIPAWPIASLAIDRISLLLRRLTSRLGDRWVRAIYWITACLFFVIMLNYVWPTLNRSLTIMALLLSALILISRMDYREAATTFLAGVALGYFLEVWGTTRLCWTYYTQEQPPLFAVLAHGMAALAFWRVRLVGERLYRSLRLRLAAEVSR